MKPFGYEDWQTTFVPHGISSRRFNKVKDDDVKLIEFEDKHGLSDKKYKILYSNRNIRRKQPGDVLLAYKYFMDGLTPEQQKECVLVFHTQPCDDNGTDLPRVHQHLRRKGSRSDLLGVLRKASSSRASFLLGVGSEVSLEQP